MNSTELPLFPHPQWVYTVVFDGAEIWGEGAAPGLAVSIDAWERYLEPV